MFCIKCGKQIPDESVFCMGCGTKVPKLDYLQTNNTPAPEKIEKKPPLAKPVFDDEVTRVVLPKKKFEEEEEKTIFVPEKVKSFESIIEEPVEEKQSVNEIFSHSEPQEIDVFSNCAEEPEEVVSKIEDVEETAEEVVEDFEEIEDTFSDNEEEPTDIFSNSEDEVKEQTSDNTKETEEIFSHSHFASQMEMAKPQFEEESDDDKTVFIGAIKEEKQEEINETPLSAKIAPPINRQVMPPIAPPVVPEVAPPVMPQVAPPVNRPVAPPVARPSRKESDMTVTMSRRMDPIPANYGVSMREDKMMPPVSVNSQPAEKPVNDFVPQPVKKKRKKIHPMAIILPIISVILAVAIIFGSIYFFTDPKDKYYVSKAVTTYYDVNGEWTNKITYEYCKENVISSYKFECRSGDTDKTVYERDEDGRVIKLTEYYGDSKRVYKFDEYEKDGSLYVATAKVTDDDVVYEYKLAYDKDELVYEKHYIDGEIDYTYEVKDNVENIDVYNEGELGETIIREYDKKDNLIKEEYKNYDDVSQDHTATYTRDKKGYITEYEKKNSDGDIVVSYTASYNKYGMRVGYNYYDEVNDVEIVAEIREENKERIIVDYFTAEGVFEEYYEYTIEDGKWTETKNYDGTTDSLKYSEKYNENGLVIEEKHYYEAGKVIQKTTYEYSKK